MATLVSLAFNNPKELGRALRERRAKAKAEAVRMIGQHQGQTLALAAFFRGAGAEVIEVKH